MELIITDHWPEINTEVIAKGDLIRAKYDAWEEERNGQVAMVTRDEIRVIWQPVIRNVTNFFVIYPSEISDGLWSLKWSPDLETVHTWPPEPPEPAEDPEEPEEPAEPDGGDDPPGGGSE